jgi:hypothetical protein
MMTEQRRHEVLDAYYSLMATKIPPGYSPSMEERMVVDRIASTLRGLEDMAGILGFAQEMGDRMARNHYLQQAQQQAAEEARLASRNSIKPKLP